MLSQIASFHSKKVTSYKRLLERAQLSSAAQLHALQAEVQMLRQTVQAMKSGATGSMALRLDDEMLCARCGGQREGAGSFWSGYRGIETDEEDFDPDILRAMRDFDEKTVRKIARRMGRESRQRLWVTIIPFLYARLIPPPQHRDFA